MGNTVEMAGGDDMYCDLRFFHYVLHHLPISCLRLQGYLTTMNKVNQTEIAFTQGSVFNLSNPLLLK